MYRNQTQLRLASVREEAYQELHDSQPMPWTARGELQKLQKGQFLDISTDTPEDDENTWKNTPWDMQTDHVETQAQEQQPPGNDFSQKQSSKGAKAAATTCLPVHTWRIHQKQDRTGAQTTQRWKSSLRWSLARTLFRKPAETCMPLSPVRPEKVVRKFFNVKCPWTRENSLIQRNQKEIKNYVVNNVLEKLEPHEKPARESILRMRLYWNIDLTKRRIRNPRLVL